MPIIIPVDWTYQRALNSNQVVVGNSFRVYLRWHDTHRDKDWQGDHLVIQDLRDGDHVEFEVINPSCNTQAPKFTKIVREGFGVLRLNDRIDLDAAVGDRLDSYFYKSAIPIGNLAAAICGGGGPHPTATAKWIPSVDQMMWHLWRLERKPVSEDAIRAMNAVAAGLAAMGGQAPEDSIARWLDGLYSPGAGIALLGEAVDTFVVTRRQVAAAAEYSYHPALRDALRLHHALRSGRG